MSTNEELPIQAGDVVRLASGSPKFTVEKVLDGEHHICECVLWVEEKGESKTVLYPMSSLVTAPKFMPVDEYAVRKNLYINILARVGQLCDINMVQHEKRCLTIQKRDFAALSSDPELSSGSDGRTYMTMVGFRLVPDKK